MEVGKPSVFSWRMNQAIHVVPDLDHDTASSKTGQGMGLR